MAKYLFVGDLHDDLEAATQSIGHAVDSGCKEIIQVGDWGFFWTRGDGHWKELSAALVEANMKMRFCDGNHDHHPRLRALKRDTEDNAAPGITYQHRGTVKEFPDGVRMLFMGGAPSIDKAWRTKNISWWEEEYITEEDVQAALSHKGKPVDIFVTHDSAIYPKGIKEIKDMGYNYRALDSKEKLLKLIEELNPVLQIHGHYHVRHTSKIRNTLVEGLGSNMQTFKDRHYIYERKEAEDVSEPRTGDDVR